MVTPSEVLGHFLEGNLSGPLAKDLSFFLSGRWRRQASAFPAAHLSTPFNLNLLTKLTYEPAQHLKLKAGGALRPAQGHFQPPKVHYPG